MRKNIALFVSAFITFAVQSSWAGPPLSDYCIYGEDGVVIGVASTVNCLTGAKNINPQTQAAIQLNGGAAIKADARSGDDVQLQNNATITGTLTRAPGSVLTLATGASVGHDVVADPELPVLPAPTPVTCPSPGPDLTFANNQSNTFAPGVYGTLRVGSLFKFIAPTAGTYVFQSITLATNAELHVVPGVKIIVCDFAMMDSVDVLPTTLQPSDFYFEAQGTEANAFRPRCGSDWIGNVYVPNGGIIAGSGDCGSHFFGQMVAGGVVRLEHAVEVTNIPTLPSPPPGSPPKTTTLFHAFKNENDGAGDSILVKYQVAGLAGFDVSQEPNLAQIKQAVLRLTVCFTPGVDDFCPDAIQGWPAAGGDIFAFRLDDGWEDWAEGNGNNYPIQNNPHGTGPGATWNCSIDTDISNNAKDCDAAHTWSPGGMGVQGPASPPVVIVNNMPDGTTVDFDVTTDVQNGLGPKDTTFMSWFVRRLNGSGSVTFYSQEGAARKGDPSLAPQLIITH